MLLSLLIVCCSLRAYPQCENNGISLGTRLLKPLGWLDLMGVPDELNRKRLKFADMHKENPLTLIDRVAFPSANEAYENIRNSLKDTSNKKLQPEGIRLL